MNLQLDIKEWRSREWYRRASATDEGAIHWTVQGRSVLVDVFTYRGDERSPPFTVLQCYIDEHWYQARLPRAYHERWLLRLARDFEHECVQRAKKRRGS